MVTELEPGLRLLRAPNPSPMTDTGTNTYLVAAGAGSVVIDPGPLDRGHLAAILTAAEAPITHILVTHAHVDHSPLARPLAQATGVPVLAYGDANAGRSAAMTRLGGDVGGGEGVDAAFAPDALLADGAQVAGMTALWTPGHFGNHLSFAWRDAVFCGDLVMGWASTLISPPDGDVGQFMASCARLRGLKARVLYPGHGDRVTDPVARIDWLTAHRRSRGAQILAALADGPATAAAIAGTIYTDTAPSLMGAAARNVLAHLVDLADRDRVTAIPTLTADAVFARR